MLVKFKLSILLFLSLLAFGCENQNQTSSDYDLICQYFGQLDTQLSQQKIEPDKFFEFIDERVEKNLKGENTAKETWKAIVGMNPPEKRYEMFKSVVESVIHKSWECPSMKKYLKDV